MWQHLVIETEAPREFHSNTQGYASSTSTIMHVNFQFYLRKKISEPISTENLFFVIIIITKIINKANESLEWTQGFIFRTQDIYLHIRKHKERSTSAIVA